MDHPEVPREDTFCSYALLSDELMEVADAQKDQRFASYSWVKHEPHIRFYAGFLLTTSAGHRVGVLCVADKKPRNLSSMQRFALGTLANDVIQRLELRAKNLRLRTSLGLLGKIGRTGTFHLDLLTDQLTLAPSLNKILGLPDTQVTFLASELALMIHPNDLFEINAYMNEQLKHGNTFHFDCRTTHHTTGDELSMVCCGDIMRDHQGVPHQLVGAVRDVTDERDWEILLKQQNIQIDKANYELDHLVYRISHDLRAPVATALGLLYLAQQEDKSVTVQPLNSRKKPSANKIALSGIFLGTLKTAERMLPEVPS